VIDAYLADFGKFEKRVEAGTPPWVRDIRRRALERFRTLGYPTMRNEDWHFTSAAPIAEQEFHVTEAPGGEVKVGDLEPFQFAEKAWPTLVFVNGRFSEDLSTFTTLPAGVRVMELARAWKEQPALLERHLSKVADFEQAAFTALNTAFMLDGAVVHVAANAVLEAPLHLLFVSDAYAAKTVAHPRTLIVAEHHANATILESYVSLGEARYFTNAVTEVVLEEGAQLRHYRIQRESERAFHVGTTEVHQARGSLYKSFSFATGARLARINIYTKLQGEGSEVWLDGLYMVDGEQHVDHQTRILHLQPNCASHEVYKGVLDGMSHGVFNGQVFVDPIAQKTDGKQTNNNLLLSDHARVDTKPQLEIFADDVKCTHGATVGRIDEMALFYMKSRGIGAQMARELLTYAFAADVIERIELDSVRTGLESLTLRRFTREEILIPGEGSTGEHPVFSVSGAGGGVRG
jgi:Fe-S cluster assembly protein SufD